MHDLQRIIPFPLQSDGKSTGTASFA